MNMYRIIDNVLWRWETAEDKNGIFIRIVRLLDLIRDKRENYVEELIKQLDREDLMRY
ncbi:hypothetical protein CCP1ISM_60006 [Azospirillaceae bacterium]